MYHVYTEKNRSDLSRTLVGEYKDFDKALEKAQKAIENKPDLRYIIEESKGHVDIYGNLEMDVAEESD